MYLNRVKKQGFLTILKMSIPQINLQMPEKNNKVQIPMELKTSQTNTYIYLNTQELTVGLKKCYY